MNRIKNFYLIASSLSLIEIAWLINSKTNLELKQKTFLTGQNIFAYFETDQEQWRVSLYKISDLNLREFIQFDFILICENYSFDLQKIKDPHYINFITKAKIDTLSGKNKRILDKI